MKNSENRDVLVIVYLYFYINNFLGKLSKLVKYVIILEENIKRNII